MPASLPPGGAGFGLCTTRGKKSMPRSGPFRVLRHGGFGRLSGERASLRLGKGLCRPFAPESGVHGRRSSPERDGPGAGKGVLARLHRPLSGLRFGAEDLGQGGAEPWMCCGTCRRALRRKRDTKPLFRSGAPCRHVAGWPACLAVCCGVSERAAGRFPPIKGACGKSQGMRSAGSGGSRAVPPSAFPPPRDLLDRSEDEARHHGPDFRFPYG